eukprot:2122859-Lingulodinium_polyedra.AAC.1
MPAARPWALAGMERRRAPPGRRGGRGLACHLVAARRGRRRARGSRGGAFRARAGRHGAAPGGEG